MHVSGPALRVSAITAAEHLAYVRGHGGVSFLQTPAWGRTKQDWRAESLGWHDPGGALVGAGLVLHRDVPVVPRSLAYLPEGPDIAWRDPCLGRWLEPLADYLRAAGAFAVRLGPRVVTRRWSGATLKRALADPGVTRLGDVTADTVDPAAVDVGIRLRALGWRATRGGAGFAIGQPRHVFQLPLAGRTADDLLRGFNQLWRRNVKRAAAAGVEVSRGTVEDLPAFHALYRQTAQRDGFTARGIAYFETMWEAMTSEDPDRLRLYLARHDGDLVAATTMVTVGRHAWYSYGASSTAKREVRGSNAVQWRMIQDARAGGADVYDLRGITETLDADDPHAGLIRFKLGTGGEAVEWLGEWELPLRRAMAGAFDAWLRRRGG